MFTGIITATSAVVGLTGRNLVVAVPELWRNEPLVLGESVSVDGCCLTVVRADEAMLFDLSDETLVRTTLGQAEPGQRVNLERAFRAGDRLGGHFVQGHIDGIAHIVSTSLFGESLVLRVSNDRPDLIVDKGSVTLDGVSLTVVSPTLSDFEVWLIPETIRRTTLGDKRAADRVNVEFDILAKHVAHLAKGILNGWPLEPPNS
jgi:riboflavin synthase